MATVHSFVSRLASAFSGQAWSDGLATEFETHLQLQIDENLRAGMSGREARPAQLSVFSTSRSRRIEYTAIWPSLSP